MPLTRLMGATAAVREIVNGSTHTAAGILTACKAAEGQTSEACPKKSLWIPCLLLALVFTSARDTLRSPHTHGLGNSDSCW